MAAIVSTLNLPALNVPGVNTVLLALFWGFSFRSPLGGFEIEAGVYLEVANYYQRMVGDFEECGAGTLAREI